MVWACGTNGTRVDAYRVLVGRLERKKNLEDLGIDGWMILKYNFKKWDGKAWTGSIWLWIGTREGLV
jgi:hypothetical protein